MFQIYTNNSVGAGWSAMPVYMRGLKNKWFALLIAEGNNNIWSTSSNPPALIEPNPNQPNCFLPGICLR